MSPKVSIIITSYCPESRKYLDECVKSVKGLLYDNYEIIIVGRPDYLPEYPDCKTISPPQMQFWNSTGLNEGAKHAAGDFLFFLNDDLVLSRTSLSNLVSSLLDNPDVGLLMPMGNDQQGRYRLSNDCSYPRGLMFCETLCLYAVLMRKSVFEQVGGFDTSLLGLDDIDYSLRVRQHGLKNAIEISSFVYHYGGVSAAHTLNDDKRKKAQEIFKAKWGFVI